jgi:hypothetical protein
MTSLVVWVAADARGPASLNIASDSRISWSGADGLLSHRWDHGKKVFASSNAPLIVGFVGDVLFPALVLPGVIDRIDRQVFRDDGATVDGLIAAVRREWRVYPAEERRRLRIYIGHRIGERMSAKFRLTLLSNPKGGNSWETHEINVPSASTCLAIDGSGNVAIEKAQQAWQASSAANTSRAIFSGFVDAVVDGTDPRSGGAPQLASLYRIGPGRLFGIIHKERRYFGGTELIGDEAVDGIDWRNALFEHADGRTKSRLAGAQPQPRPPML